MNSSSNKDNLGILSSSNIIHESYLGNSIMTAIMGLALHYSVVSSFTKSLKIIAQSK